MTIPPAAQRRLATLRTWGKLPVPFFTIWIDGKPDFRFHDPVRHNQAIRKKRCGICGQKLSSRCWFLLGPEGLASRAATYMPAMHEECALAAVAMCPWITGTRDRRVEADYLQPRCPETTLVECRNYEAVAHPEVAGVLCALPGEYLSQRVVAQSRRAA